MKATDLSGKVFGKLKVVGLSEDKGGKHLMWDCLCDCGVKKSVRGSHLNGGRVVSCGCFRRENVRAIKTTHGLRDSRTYRIWRNMLNRCHYSKYAERHYYSERGIAVCDSWRESFENFLADMGQAPEGLSIDRINNDGNYEPGNCRWATSIEQAANRTKGNRYISPRGSRPSACAEHEVKWSEK